MVSFEYRRWALIAPNDDTGLGRMAQDLKAVLPVGRHLVTSTGRLPNRPLVESNEALLPSDCLPAELEALLSGLDGAILLERHSWHPELLQTCRRMGVRTVCVPMWEWFRGRSPQWSNCDFFACPNEYCLRVVRSYGFDNSAMVPWAFDLSRFPSRVVTGSGRSFIHNAGLVDADDRKGTHDAITAFERCPEDHIGLTVRSQKPFPVSSIDPRIKVEIGNITDPSDLYASGDVFIQPSKLEGIGFMVLEAVASGLPVITLNAAPMNEWVRRPEMLAKSLPFRFPAYSSAWIEHSHLRLPSIGSLTSAIRWAADHDLEEISRENRAWAEEVFDPMRIGDAWQECLEGVLRRPVNGSLNNGAEPPFPCHSLGSRIRARITKITGRRLPVMGFSIP